MLTKEKIKKSIDALSDDFSIEDIFEEIIILDKIEKGLEDFKNGNTFTTEEVKTKLEKWLK